MLALRWEGVEAGSVNVADQPFEPVRSEDAPATDDVQRSLHRERERFGRDGLAQMQLVARLLRFRGGLGAGVTGQRDGGDAAHARLERFVMCLDVCGVDYLTYSRPRSLPTGVQAERYEVVANFQSHTAGGRIRTRVQVPEGDPVCPSLWSAHAGVENPEREAFDMFGIIFEGHPDMTRILMPETWQGHPLRKDFSIGRIPVQFKASPS